MKRKVSIASIARDARGSAAVLVSKAAPNLPLTHKAVLEWAHAIAVQAYLSGYSAGIDWTMVPLGFRSTRPVKVQARKRRLHR